MLSFDNSSDGSQINRTGLSSMNNLQALKNAFGYCDDGPRGINRARFVAITISTPGEMPVDDRFV